MFCSECGQRAGGKFCSGCGARIATDGAAPEPLALPAGPTPDWRFEDRYETLIVHPIVKERIARAASKSKPGVTGEMLLEAFDKLAGSPVSSKTLAGVIQPLYAKMGIVTGKSRDGVFRSPIGAAIVAVACSLARNGQAIAAVRQQDGGCEIDAKLPSDACALEGSLLVAIRREGDGARLKAATTIGGQWFDWGKSTRCLARLFDEVAAELAADAVPNAAAA